MVLKYGNSQYISHGRPKCKMGNIPAHATANSVMASAKRLMELRQRWLSSKRMAEISVPACPIPIHQTKLVMSHAHMTGARRPQVPVPLASSTATESRNRDRKSVV